MPENGSTVLAEVRNLLGGDMSGLLVQCGYCERESAADGLKAHRTDENAAVLCPECASVLAVISRVAGRVRLEFATPSRWQLPPEPFGSPFGAEAR